MEHKYGDATVIVPDGKAFIFACMGDDQKLTTGQEGKMLYIMAMITALVNIVLQSVSEKLQLVFIKSMVEAMKQGNFLHQNIDIAISYAGNIVHFGRKN